MKLYIWGHLKKKCWVQVTYWEEVTLEKVNLTWPDIYEDFFFLCLFLFFFYVNFYFFLLQRMEIPPRPCKQAEGEISKFTQLFLNLIPIYPEWMMFLENC